MNPKINFITVAVTNIEKSRAFYQNAFNFPVSEQGDTLCLFHLNDNFFFVIQEHFDFAGQTGETVEQASSTNFILSHNAESKQQVDQIVEQARAHGAILIKTMDEEWGYSVTVKDINNYYWEILYAITV